MNGLLRFCLCCFIFVAFRSVSGTEPFCFEETQGNRLTLKQGEKPVLTYCFDWVEHDQVPKKDPRRRAGCYVHPLYGLQGEILTDNAPSDHYHHHGVFWTWPHVELHQPDGNTEHYDLWTSNTALKQRFVRWISRETTDQDACFVVENGWFIDPVRKEKKIMTEQVSVRVHRDQQDEQCPWRAVDFEFVWTPTEHPITLRGSQGKSYGGFSVRFRPYVPEQKSGSKPKLATSDGVNKITVPDGFVKHDLPETPLAWSDYTSRFGTHSDFSGAAVFVPKEHPDFPPTWLTRYYGVLAVGWPGVNGKTFEKGEEIRLKYRIWIHHGPVSLDQLKRHYRDYCNSSQK